MHRALLLFFVFLTAICSAKIDQSTVRAVLLQKFANYTEWPKGAITDSFSIGIAGRDTAVVSNLLRLTKDKTIHKRPVKIVAFTSPSQIEKCQMLYVCPDENYRIEKYWENTDQTPVLFVTENLPNMLFSMISIEYNQSSKTFSFLVNKSNLLMANLQAHPDLLLVGGTEIDVRDLYKSTKKQLDIELNKVNEQKKLIAQQLKKILSQNENLEKKAEQLQQQVSSINLHKQIINNQRGTLDSISNRIKHKEDSIRQNKQLISTQQDIISQQKKSVKQKETELERLNGQLQYIAKQIHKKQQVLNAKDIQLEEKEVVITSQQQYILYMLVASAFILLLLSFIIYAYRSKTKANKTLDEKNIILEDQQREIQKQSEELQTINNQLNAQKIELEQTIIKLQETQSQLVQSEKMASLGTLTAGIAHEINNPINFITTGIEGLKTVTEPMTQFVNYILSSDPKEHDKSIINISENFEIKELIEGLELMTSNIETGANRAAEIVKGLNEFSRSSDTELVQTDLHKNIESTLLILNNELKNRITIEKYYEPIPYIFCYPNKINQVLLNIIGNAAQAIKEKGTIRITTQSFGSDNIKLKIADTGSGIGDTDLKRIFEPFFTTKEVGRGTGLGLAISYSIVEQHQGEITVKSELGKGTEFSIVLPISPSI